MRVVALEVRHVRLPLKKPVRHASHVRTSTDNVVVKVSLSDGKIGFGEGVPREYVTGETAEGAVELLKASDLPAQLSVCRSFTDAVAMAERITLKPVPGDDRQCAGNSARCAVELALLDAFGRSFGEPLMNVTKQLSPELYKPQDTIRYSGIILSARGLKLNALAWGMRLLGFRQVKLKVGIAGQDDAKRLRQLRARFGSRDIRLDANEAWNIAELEEKVRQLEAFFPSSLEQPVPHEQVRELPALRKKVRTPIMLDESLCSLVDAEQAAAEGWCDLFNLRLSKVGGFIPALRLMQFAQRSGLGCQLGCQVGESAILSSAGRHFATSVNGLKSLEGSYDRYLLHDALGTEDCTFRRGGKAPMLTGSGLGTDIDPARLDAVTARTEVLIG
jgi:L-Ala-D/L-Glu epimerase